MIADLLEDDFSTASFDGTIGLSDLMWSRERIALTHPGGKVHAVAYRPQAVAVAKADGAK